MNPPVPRTPGSAPSETNNHTLFDQEQVASMQAEMQRLMQDYPDGDIPDEVIAEWESRAEAAKLGHEAEMLESSIATDEVTAKRARADKPPADMTPQAQDEPGVIKLNRADAKLATQIARLYAVLGIGVSMLNQADGILIISSADERARELVLVANHHPALKKGLRNLTESNDYITFAFGHGTLALAILQSHGIMPRDIGARLFGMFKRPSAAQVSPQG